VYPDSEHWWMLSKNHLKIFSFGGRFREYKNICKTMGENENFREIFRENENLLPGLWIRIDLNPDPDPDPAF
jgi:hypothetical protein